MILPTLRKRLETAHPLVFSVYCISGAFGAYFCMYAFRKPFTAGEYADTTLGGMSYKSALVIAQVLGYTISKFIGIRIVSEIAPERRAAGILILIGIAELSLFFFGVVPPPWNIVFLFANGLPLGMVFGLVLGFLEGRRVTEALTAGLCASFILSSGVVKSVGQALILHGGVSEYWMPSLTGLIFVVPLLISVWMLAHIPPPSIADEALRSHRAPMDAAARQATFWKYAPGLTLLVGVYLTLTIVRSVRDDFAVEIWRDLGHAKTPAIFAQSETLVMLVVVAVNGVAIVVRDNRLAFNLGLGVVTFGFAALLAATFGLHQQWISPFAFMVVGGIALYVPYVAFHTTIFERMIAVFRERANLTYLMYLADAFGYLGYVAVILLRSFGSERIQVLPFFLLVSCVAGVTALIMMVTSIVWFQVRLRRQSAEIVS